MRFLSRLLILRRMCCSSGSDRSLRSFLESIFRDNESSSALETPSRSAPLKSGGESLCVEETAPEKPPDFLTADMKRSSPSGEEGLLDTRLVSESMVFSALSDSRRCQFFFKRREWLKTKTYKCNTKIKTKSKKSMNTV